MILHSVTQGTTEWAALRAGIPTASAFDQIITAVEAKPSKSRKPYMHHLLAERLLGRPIEKFQSGWMKHGKDLEAEAVVYYEALHNIDTVPVGFVTDDARTYGASPDRFVGDDGILEVKCPAPNTHVKYLLDPEGASGEYRVQTQGQLWVCERQWTDVFSYCPGLPDSIVRVHRDDIFIAKLEAAMAVFLRELETHHAQLSGGLAELLGAV